PVAAIAGAGDVAGGVAEDVVEGLVVGGGVGRWVAPRRAGFDEQAARTRQSAMTAATCPRCMATSCPG
ncbi:MAG: hypothetical protein ACRDJU_02155, partial [Actinomycetota bacterium]